MTLSPELARLKELMEKTEPLDPELERYLTETDIGPAIKHPLHFSIFHTPQMNAMSNDIFRQKRAIVKESWDEGNYRSYVWMHERPYRLDAFMDAADLLTDEEYWDLLGQIWIDSENIHQNYDEWEDALTADRPGREGMMSADEQAALAKLPAVLTIWRGYLDAEEFDNRAGLSWTLDCDRAIWFAQRFAREGTTPMLAEGTVQKTDVIAYFEGRGEQEIVALPDDLTIKETRQL